MVEIPILEGKSFIIDYAGYDIASIISNISFLYCTECAVDLVLSLSLLIFRFFVVSCSCFACVCRIDGIIYASIFLSSLSA